MKFLLLLFLALTVPSAMNASAAPLFPPDGVDRTGKCPTGTILQWTGESGGLKCERLASLLPSNCKGNSYLTVLNGNLACKDIPVCHPEQAILGYQNGQFACEPIPSCPPGKSLTKLNNGGFMCVHSGIHEVRRVTRSMCNTDTLAIYCNPGEVVLGGGGSSHGAHMTCPKTPGVFKDSNDKYYPAGLDHSIPVYDARTKRWGWNVSGQHFAHSKDNGNNLRVWAICATPITTQ